MLISSKLIDNCHFLSRPAYLSFCKNRWEAGGASIHAGVQWWRQRLRGPGGEGKAWRKGVSVYAWLSFFFLSQVLSPCLVDRSTLKMFILNSPREGRWVSTWRASRSMTLLTSEDPVVFLFTKAKVSASTCCPEIEGEKMLVCSQWWYKLSFSCLLMLASFFLFTGAFAIQEDKKSPAVIKNAKHVGMIAGGTGKRNFESYNSKHQQTNCGHKFTH